MESWRDCWRKGVAPLLSTKSLEALREALANDDRRLIQGVTTYPPNMVLVEDAPVPVKAACPLGFCGWAEGLTTVAEVADYVSRLCLMINERLGEVGGCRWFLNAYDDWPRQEMIANLLPEVELELAKRRSLGERSEV